jgi:hypothetical protein
MTTPPKAGDRRERAALSQQHLIIADLFARYIQRREHGHSPYADDLLAAAGEHGDTATDVLRVLLASYDATKARDNAARGRPATTPPADDPTRGPPRRRRVRLCLTLTRAEQFTLFLRALELREMAADPTLEPEAMRALRADIFRTASTLARHGFDFWRGNRERRARCRRAASAQTISTRRPKCISAELARGVRPLCATSSTAAPSSCGASSRSRSW